MSLGSLLTVSQGCSQAVGRVVLLCGAWASLPGPCGF